MWLDPAAAVGNATVATTLPSRRRSSTNAAVAPLPSAAVPVPTRTTRKVSVLQAALPSHVFEPSVAQIALAGRFGFVGAPFVQTSFVHGLPSTGRSVSST